MKFLFPLFFLIIAYSGLAQNDSSIISLHFDKQNKNFWFTTRTYESSGSLIWNGSVEEKMDLKMKVPLWMKISSKSHSFLMTPNGNQQKNDHTKSSRMSDADSLLLSPLLLFGSPLFYINTDLLVYKGPVSVDGKICHWLVHSQNNTEYFVEVETSLFYKSIYQDPKSKEITYTVIRYEVANEVYVPRLVEIKSSEKSILINMENTVLGRGIPSSLFKLD